MRGWGEPRGQRNQRREDHRGADRNVRRCRAGEEDRARTEHENTQRVWSARERGYTSQNGWQGRRDVWRAEPSRHNGHWQQNEEHSRQESPKSLANTAKVNVVIASLAGVALLGPEEMSCSLPIVSLKERIRKARPGNGVSILHELTELMDHDTLAACPTSSESTLNLTAVLTKTFGVVVWGESTYGGSAAPSLLEDGVLELFSSSGAFAAIKEGGAVVAWGHGAYGGDMGQAARQLTRDVTTICAGQNAFVAVTKSGAAVSWGNASLGGRQTAAVAKKLNSSVTSVKSSGEAFAALKGCPGEVVAWGQAVSGGDSASVAQQIASGVVALHSTRGAFAALKEDGRVVTWGNSSNGGDSTSLSDELSCGVEQIFSNTTSFAALKKGGRVVAWGNRSCGGFLGSLAESLSSGVIAIYNSASAFAALKSDGAVITWGQPGHPSMAAELMARGGIAVKANGRAFAMVLESGECVIEGDANAGGDAGEVASHLRSGVTALASTQGAFAALKEDGSVVTWGRGKPVNLGADSSSVASHLERGVLSIFGTQSAFAALRDVSTPAH